MRSPLLIATCFSIFAFSFVGVFDFRDVVFSFFFPDKTILGGLFGKEGGGADMFLTVVGYTLTSFEGGTDVLLFDFNILSLFLN